MEELDGAIVEKGQRTGPYQHLCILNENVFEHILSFLSNQALTKLHGVTGDNYPKCEPLLAPYCCECENDNPKFDDICRDCESKMDDYTPFVAKEVATTVYGLKIRELATIPQFSSSGATVYSCVDLENYLIRKYGSKMGWLREIARRDMVTKKIQVIEQQPWEERERFVESLAPGFSVYALLIGLEESNKGFLLQCGRRFDALTTALKARGLQLRPESKVCEHFILSGSGKIAKVVDAMEELRFLNGCTDYPRRCRKIENILNDSEIKQERMEEAKMELCIAYLENHRGLDLPRKWENCRSRFEEVQQAGGIPQCEVRYIYSE
ncbi:hypothetical protein PHMEG_00031008 [Phytophthora megakarya]|uniref:Uncharacterized protein n=1 Tax=Phytophthora megakarya TaxID=4795 RepID=A0A225UYS1_9STRA|nr:hypothetical protein PHMEG_00031008 [Phytophthora megakarya]